MSNYSQPEVVVETQWLVEHLNDANVRIVEVNVNPQVSISEAIPETVVWNSFTDLMLPDYRINLDPANMEKLLSRSGINNNSTVIAYGDAPAAGAWVFWLLKVFGHQDVRILNGGRSKWIAEKLPLAPVQPVMNQTQYRLQEPDSNLRVLYKNVHNSIEQPDTVIVDVRTAQEYSGEWFYDQPPEENQRTGHIPGAIHLYYESALNEHGTFKSVEELRNIYESKGITADKKIITYCAVGARSSHTWFVLKYLLGYPDVRNYDGSWNEWSRNSDS